MKRRRPKECRAGLPSPPTARSRLALATQQVTHQTTVHGRKNVVSQRPHQYRLVRDNMSQSDREGLRRVVVGEGSDYRFGVGFPGGPFLLHAANCIGSLGEEKAGLTRHGVSDDFGIEVVPSIWACRRGDGTRALTDADEAAGFRRAYFLGDCRNYRLDPLGGRSRGVVPSERIAQPFTNRPALLIAGVCEAEPSLAQPSARSSAIGSLSTRRPWEIETFAPLRKGTCHAVVDDLQRQPGPDRCNIAKPVLGTFVRRLDQTDHSLVLVALWNREQSSSSEYPYAS